MCEAAKWNSTYKVVAGTGAKGSDSRQLFNPIHVGFDGLQNMYVVDQTNNRIQMFNESKKS